MPSGGSEDEPLLVPDPAAEAPDDWDDEEDGELGGAGSTTSCGRASRGVGAVGPSPRPHGVSLPPPRESPRARVASMASRASEIDEWRASQAPNRAHAVAARARTVTPAAEIANPKCDKAPRLRARSPPKIDNPEYKGKWYQPQIDNPDYKGGPGRRARSPRRRRRRRWRRPKTWTAPPFRPPCGRRTAALHMTTSTWGVGEAEAKAAAARAAAAARVGGGSRPSSRDVSSLTASTALGAPPRASARAGCCRRRSRSARRR